MDRILVSKWKHTDIVHHLQKLPKQFTSEVKAYIRAFTPDDEKTAPLVETQPSQQETYTDHSGKEQLQPQKISEEDIVKCRKIVSAEEVDTNDVNIMMLDLGEQEIYYTIHFLFLAQEDVIFIAVQDLNKPVVSRQRLNRFKKKVEAQGMQTNLKAIKSNNALSFYCHCGKEVADRTLHVSNWIPTIVLVGTHAKGLPQLEKGAIRFFILESFLLSHFLTIYHDC